MPLMRPAAGGESRLWDSFVINREKRMKLLRLHKNINDVIDFVVKRCPYVL